MRITRVKQDQAKQDMYNGLEEKARQRQQMKELEEQENIMLKRYQEETDAREREIRQQKAMVEAEREAIFEKLKAEEE